MTREEALESIKVLQHYADGGHVAVYFLDNNNPRLVVEPNFNFGLLNYKIFETPKKRKSTAQLKKDHWPDFSRLLGRCCTRVDIATVWKDIKSQEDEMPEAYYEACMDEIDARKVKLGL